MIDPLQEFSFRESNYERPNQDWECGWAAQGEPCHIGPNGAGICQAHRECVPYKEGDRYKCARPANFGGKCQLGPRPDGICSECVVECQPARTLRNRRKMFTYTVAALSLGCCLIMFGGSWANSFTSPGELTLQHHSNQQTCSDCHKAAIDGFANWVGSVAAGDPVSNDSRKCLKCHGRLGPQPLMAHGLDKDHLKMLTADVHKSESSSGHPFVLTMVDVAARNPLDEKNGLACALCHHEHRGAKFDLTQLTNVQCQSCHTGQFHSFANGHPEFAGYPYERRMRIYFDHVTHYRVHFKSFERVKPGAVVPTALRDYGKGEIPSAESCTACHRADSSGKMMPIQGFEHSCAACHGAEIEDDALPGISLLAVPHINAKAFEENSALIGEWPQLQKKYTPKPYELKVPPLMELLLAGDAGYIADRKVLAGITLAEPNTDWNLLTEKQQQAVQHTAWRIKRLLHEFVIEGESAGARRLSHLKSVLRDDADKAHLANFLASLFHDPTFISALKQAQPMWFPHIEDDIRGLDEKSPPAATSTQIEQPATDHSASSGWYVDPLDGSIRYRPTGHSDRLIRSVLDLAARVPNLLDNAKSQATTRSPTTQSARRSLSKLFGMLGDPTASYRCLGCHTADKQPDGRLKINWVGRHISPDSQSFTKFSHGPHLTLLAKNDCGKCHMPQKDVKFARQEFVKFLDGYTVNTNPHAGLTSGFAPLSKLRCAQCHTTQLAGDNCLKCHNYHIFK